MDDEGASRTHLEQKISSVRKQTQKQRPQHQEQQLRQKFEQKKTQRRHQESSSLHGSSIVDVSSSTASISAIPKSEMKSMFSYSSERSEASTEGSDGRRPLAVRVKEKKIVSLTVFVSSILYSQTLSVNSIHDS